MNDDIIGTTLSHCVIEALLGQGGMARVYRGRQENLDRDVAIKLLPPYYAADPAFVERFKLEARAMARLTHPHIVTVHDAGEENGRLFIIMEYVAGGTLKQRMAQGMALREVTRIINEVASALTYAHTMGIVHRDVKPVNVLMDTSGRAVLSDFGIAKVLATSAVLTQSGAGVGTPEYMSPEQCKGGAVDARSDIYALGVMLYEMLAGRTPFEADNYTALAHAHIYEPAPPPSGFNPRISLAVQAVIMKALEKDPADRFQKATELAAAFEQAVAAQAPIPAAMPRGAAGGTRQDAPPGQYAPRAAAPVVSSVAPAALQPIICPRCHAQNAGHQRFCSACGQPLRAGAAGARQAQQQPSGVFTLCPHCRAPNNQINRFCTTCGQTLLVGVPGVTCRNCGQRNAPGQHYCTNCGQTLR